MIPLFSLRGLNPRYAPLQGSVGAFLSSSPGLTETGPPKSKNSGMIYRQSMSSKGGYEIREVLGEVGVGIVHRAFPFSQTKSRVLSSTRSIFGGKVLTAPKAFTPAMKR